MASLNLAPPARSERESGAKTLAVRPSGVAVHQRPLGMLATPGRMVSSTATGTVMRRRPLVTTACWPWARPRASASAGDRRTDGSGVSYSPNMLVMLRLVAGVSRTSVPPSTSFSAVGREPVGRGVLGHQAGPPGVGAGVGGEHVPELDDALGLEAQRQLERADQQLPEAGGLRVEGLAVEAEADGEAVGHLVVGAALARRAG